MMLTLILIIALFSMLSMPRWYRPWGFHFLPGMWFVRPWYGPRMWGMGPWGRPPMGGFGMGRRF